MISTEDIYKKLKEGKNLKDKISFTHKQKTKGKSIRMSIGRIWFNTLLPDNFPLIDEPVDHKILNKILVQIYNKYKTEESIKIIKNLQQEAFKLASISPNTFNIDALIIPPDLQKEKDEFTKNAKNMSVEQFTKKSDELTKKFVKYIKSKGLSIQNVIEGGVKGGLADWKILLIAKGYTVDIENNINGPIAKGLVDGLTAQEYYIAAAEARRGFFLKSTAVQNPVYLSKKIITACAGITYDNKDCKSRKYLEMRIDKSRAELINGRYYKDGNTLKLIKDGTKLIGKTIKLRSPLYCKSPNGICKICFGKLSEDINSKNLGIVSGGSLNNVLTNRMMKARHKGSQVEIINVDFEKDIRKAGLSLAKLKTLLDIQQNKIIAKKPCRVTLLKNDYTISGVLIDSSDKFILPGIFDIYFGEGEKTISVTLPFNFKVNLYKPKEYIDDTKKYSLEYNTGDVIIEKQNYIKEFDVGIIESILEARLKFIKKPEIMLNYLLQELGNVDLCHLELVLSNMFRDADDIQKPCRLTSYKNPIILGQQKIPFETSWLGALSFENINKAINIGLIKGQDAKIDPLIETTWSDFKNI